MLDCKLLQNAVMGPSLIRCAQPHLPAALPPTCAATYFTFAAIGVAAVVTIRAIVPETKGKTLEEIEALWDVQR